MSAQQLNGDPAGEPPEPKYSVRDNCERLKDEWAALERKWHTLRNEAERQQLERAHYEAHFLRYYETAYKLHVELQVQTEVNKRTHTILRAMLSQLSPERQRELASQIDDAKNVTPADVESHMEQGGFAPRTAPALDMDYTKPDIMTAADIVEEVPQKKTPIVESLQKENWRDGAASPTTPTGRKDGLGGLEHSPRPEEAGFGMGELDGDEAGPAPDTIRPMATLPHGDVVCAVAVSNNARNVYTGGKGCVKVWDMFQPQMGALAELDCLKDHYIRSCKLLADADILIVGGEADQLCMWDLGGTSPSMVGYLDTTAPACYALAVSPLTAPSRSALCFACCSDGKINVFDVHNKKLIKSFVGHADGASCVDITRDGTKLVTGGLDKVVRVWDLHMFRPLEAVPFQSQIFSLGVGNNDWIAAGLENSDLMVFNPNPAFKSVPQIRKKHRGPVLSLKFSHAGNWFATTGKDAWLNGWNCPAGKNVFEWNENTSILACDISLDDKYIVTGSGDKLATVYEVA